MATPHNALSVRKRPLSRNPESSYSALNLPECVFFANIRLFICKAPCLYIVSGQRDHCVIFSLAPSALSFSARFTAQSVLEQFGGIEKHAYESQILSAKKKKTISVNRNSSHAA